MSAAAHGMAYWCTRPRQAGSPVAIIEDSMAWNNQALRLALDQAPTASVLLLRGSTTHGENYVDAIAPIETCLRFENFLHRNIGIDAPMQLFRELQ